MRSQTAARLGIDNTPPADVIPRLVTTAERILEPCRDFFETPFSPSSWFRSAELNAVIGGSKTSQHVTGEAVDFEIPGFSNFDVARWIEANLEFDQLILECHTPGDLSSGWIHCSFATPHENRKSVMTYNRKDGYMTGLIG